MELVITNNPNAYIVLGTVLLTFLVSFIIIFIILYNKAQLKFQLERQAFQQALLQTEIEIREQTLTNVSRELHDNIGQIASLLKINLNQLAATDADLARFKDSKDLLQKLITDVKEISSSLKGNRLMEVGLAKAIESDCERMNKLGQIEVSFQENMAELELENSNTIFLYRMYQEAVNNVLSHSQASEVRITLSASNQAFSMNIRDNGIGFNQEGDEKGNGLKNLTERSKTIGAQLSINSKPKEGTEIIITLPITNNGS